MNLVLLLQLVGLMHIGFLAAGLLMPRVVRLSDHLVVLPPFIRNLFWVYYSFIGITLIFFGTLSFFFASELASGTPLARSLCMFLAVFWTIRFMASCYVFDLRPYLTTNSRRVGYYILNGSFAMLPVVYLWSAIAGGGQ